MSKCLYQGCIIGGIDQFHFQLKTLIFKKSSHIFIGRLKQQFFGPSGLYYFPLIQQEYPVCQLEGFLYVVGDEDDRFTF
jgi:hypothetical protein